MVVEATLNTPVIPRSAGLMAGADSDRRDARCGRATHLLFGDTILISGRFRCFALWPSFLQRELALEKLLLLRDPFVGRQWPPSPQLRLDRLGQRLACRVG